jgi:hypothetical protein
MYRKKVKPMFYTGWLHALSKGKAKEKASAMTDINQWIKHPESEDALDSYDWQKVLACMYIDR